ncbi:MAG TPA: universal stress protein [Agriterribacter sp.]|nr:universal stress protein [Agriterribacter sp.]
MKIIIVPTDFSPVAINAMNYAVDMAQQIDATIMLLHVYQIPVTYNNSDIPLPFMDVGELERINKERLEDLKKEVEHISAGDLKIVVEVRLGELVDELKTICIDSRPFAVVMGTKGAGFVERLLVGSSTLSAMKHLPCPVLVIPPGANFKGIQKMGLASDFKKGLQSIPAGFIKDWVKMFGAVLSVVHVDDDKKPGTAVPVEPDVSSQALLAELSPQYVVIENPDVESAIQEFAETNNLDLLIVMPRKHRLLDSLFQKSHTKELAFHSHIPILSIHEDE